VEETEKNTFNDFYYLKIVKSEKLVPKWQKIAFNYEIVPRFGHISIYNQGFLYIHSGQNYFNNEYFADLFKIKVSFKEGINKDNEKKKV